MAPAPAAASTPVAAALQALAAAASAATVTPAMRAGIPGADVRELLRRLALDSRIVRESESDTTTLTVDLDHGHIELVALLQDILDGLHPLAGLDVRDVKETVGALRELDEGPERGRLHDLALELVADLGLLGHRLYAGTAGVDQGAARRVHLDRAVVLDIDVGLELLRQPADRLAALADDRPDLVGVDLDLLDPWRELRQLLARTEDGLLHLVEDEEPPLTSLLERVAQDVEGDPGDLDVHLQGCDPIGRAGDLEVHVAEVILDAGDVREHDMVFALLDQSHGHTGHRARHGHASGHQGHRGRANRAHRGRPVGLKRLRDHPDHVREVLLAGDRRDERSLGEGPVTDVAALRATHEARLPDRVRREVVVVPERLRLLQAEVVDAHVHAGRAQRHVGENLRFAAGEQRRAMHPWRDVNLALDRPNLVLTAPIGPLLVDRDTATDDVLLELVESARDLGTALRIDVGALAGAGVLLENLCLDRLRGVLPGELLRDLRRLVELVSVRALDLLQQLGIDLRLDDLELLLAGLGAKLLDRRADLLDLLVGDVESVEDLRLAHALGSTLDHQDGFARTRDDQVHLELLVSLLRRVDHEVPVKLSDPHRADVGRHRDRRNSHRGRSCVHREDVVRVLELDRQRLADDLRLVVPSLGEQRAQRPVDHAGSQSGLLARAAFAAEEGSGDLSGRVMALLDVDGQWQKLHVPQVADGRGAQHHRVARARDNCAARLASQLARLEGDLLAAYLHRDAAHVKHAHVFLSLRPPG